MGLELDDSYSYPLCSVEKQRVRVSHSLILPLKFHSTNGQKDDPSSPLSSTISSVAALDAKLVQAKSSRGASYLLSGISSRIGLKFPPAHPRPEVFPQVAAYHTFHGLGRLVQGTNASH